MTEKELKKMNRLQLLQIMYEQSAEIERLQKKIERLEQELDDRQIMMDKTGSIAEASLQLNGVFKAAQKAADQYVENVKIQYETAQKKCEAMEKNCALLEKQTKERCRKFLDEVLTLISAYTDDEDFK